MTTNGTLQRGLRRPVRLAALSIAVAAAIAMPALPAAGAAADAAAPVPGGSVFAVVGNKVISADEFQAALSNGMRQKFYHGKPPEREVAAYQREVGANLVNRVLLLDEARRRNLAPDKAEVTKVIDGYDQRYKDSAQWKANRERLLPDLVAQLEGNTLLRALEQQVRAVAAPSERQVREYYAAHSDQFTEPDQIRLSIILLRVDPSSPKSAWEKAREEAEGIHRRLQRGSSFAELARMHSNDNSAANGGDVGYVHRGMLPEAIQEQVVDKLSTGQVSGPIPLLEGIAIVRVEDRKAAKLRSFEDVRARAADLWRRDQGEAAWTALIANLRRKATIRVDESRYLPLDAPVAQPAPGGRG